MASISTAVTALHFAAVASNSRRKSGRVSAANQTHCNSSATAVNSQASLYQVLRIPMGATAPEIKAAYRKLARVLHPDVNCAGDGEIGGEFMSVHEAYSILRDPKKRADYDRSLFRRGRTGGRSYSVLSAGNCYSGYTARSWETDQCW